MDMAMVRRRARASELFADDPAGVVLVLGASILTLGAHSPLSLPGYWNLAEFVRW